MEIPRSPALRAEHPRLLLELSRHVVATLDLQEVLTRSIDAFRRVVPFEGALIRLLEDGALLTAATAPQGDDALQVRVPADAGLAGAVLATVEPVYVADVTGEQATDPSVLALAAEAPVRTYLGIALTDGEGLLGIVELGAPAPNAFSRDQIGSALLLAPSVAVAISNAQKVAASSREPAGMSQALDEDFISLVAHELRTPLAIVLGCAETVAAKAPDLDTAVVEDLSRRTVAAGHRLERLIGDLFDMSRIRSGTLRLTPVPTSLQSIVASAAGQAPEGLHVSIDLGAGLPLVSADPNRLVQVLRILLDNARKHAGEHAEVDVRATRDRDRVCIEVSDRGPGVAPEVLHRIFDPFVQAEEPMTRSVGGLGAGLYLARGICELMGAEIGAGARGGGGMTFSIRLAAATDSPEPAR
ncbi:MAG: ATP-binding protein [Actinomycetota bacterium]